MFPNPVVPTLYQTPTFESALSTFKDDVIAHIVNYDTELANSVIKNLAVESSFSTKLVEACTYILLHKIRQDNDKILNNFAPFSRGENLDLVVSNLGLERQVIKKGDESAIPPIPDVMESDEQLLLRYYLVPYTLKPGSAKGYEFECLTLGEKPQISVDTSEENKVVVSYVFDPDNDATRITDAIAKRTAPGEVTIHVLGRDGVADNALIDAVSEHLHRRDVKEETDTLIINAAAHIDYSIHVRVPTPVLSTPEFVRQQAEMALTDFTRSNRKLNNEVRPEHIGGELHSLGITGYQVVSPSEPVIADTSSAPNCTGITVEFI